jgi:hypothetical protein
MVRFVLCRGECCVGYCGDARVTSRQFSVFSVSFSVSHFGSSIPRMNESIDGGSFGRIAPTEENNVATCNIRTWR